VIEIIYRSEIKALTNVMLFKFESWFFRQMTQILEIASEKVINANYVVTVCEQHVAEMGSEKASSARNKNSHSVYP